MNLNRLLGNQICVCFRKVILVINQWEEWKTLLKLLCKGINIFKIICFYGKNRFHKKKHCIHKNISTKTKLIWVSKGTCINPNRPMRLLHRTSRWPWKIRKRISIWHIVLWWKMSYLRNCHLILWLLENPNWSTEILL